jgi:UDP-glucose 4-epimerase
MSPKKVLITGGAGFIGSNLARYLLQKGGATVQVLDNLFTGREQNLAGLDIDMVNGSVSDPDVVRRLTRGKDIVFHLAARNVIVSSPKPYADMDTNIRGTYVVFEECLRANVPRIVYSSTSSIYGNALYLPINEDSKPQFLNNYSVSKFAGESYAQCFWERELLPVTVVRYTNVYGYNQDLNNPYSGVIGKFIYWALAGDDIKIHGDGMQTRDFTFIDDACEASLLAGTMPRAIGQIYNVGSGVETSINDLAQRIVALCGSGSRLVHVERRDIDNIRRRVLNIEKARLELRHLPKTTLDDGLRLTIDHARAGATIASPHHRM